MLTWIGKLWECPGRGMEGRGRPHPGLRVEHKHLDRFSQVGWGKWLKCTCPGKTGLKRWASCRSICSWALLTWRGLRYVTLYCSFISSWQILMGMLNVKKYTKRSTRLNLDSCWCDMVVVVVPMWCGRHDWPILLTNNKVSTVPESWVHAMEGRFSKWF